jgi:16S rRNA (cytidine1402-2'-O)-methyltransferase
MGTLYLVATPIGNLQDISLRALHVLGEVRLIAAEDTRQTGKLLTHYRVRTPVTSYHEHNKISKLPEILAALAEGDVALVSDAGTPGLNDPGYELVRAAVGAGYPVSPIPGPSAPVAALTVSGLPSDSFLYLGYLPRKQNDRRGLLDRVASLPYTLIFLETPHRLLDALTDIKEKLGDRQLAVARELTKLHEEIFRGSLSQAQAHFMEQPPRGEITLVVAGKATRSEPWDEVQLVSAIQERLAGGEPAAHIAAQLAGMSGWPRRKVYQVILSQTAEKPGET